MYKKKIFILVVSILTISMILAACAPAATPTESAAAPTEAPAEPTEAPAEPTAAPVEPTEAPAEPTEAPPEPTEEPAPAGPDPSGQTVTFWHVWGTGTPNEGLLAIVDQFNATNEWGITVDALDQGNYSDVEDAMNVSIQSGDVPNLVVAYSNALANWWQVDVLADLDSLIYDPSYGLTEEEIADFYEAAFMGPVMADGSRVGFPLSLSGNVMFYNVTWAQELGFENPPANTAEFIEQACAATAANNADDNPDNDGTGGLVMYVGASNVASWAYAFGDDMLADDGSGYAFDTPEMQGVAAFLKELWDQGCAFETESYPNPEFATRKALFTMSSTVGIPYQTSAFEAEDAFTDDQWIFIPFMGPDGQQAVNAFSQTIGLVNTTPEQNLAAWLFLKYLADPETQATWINASAYYPTRKSVSPLLADYSAQNPQWETGLQLLSVGQSEPARASWTTVRREVQNTFSAILQSDPDQIEPLLIELDAVAAEAVAELDQP